MDFENKVTTLSADEETEPQKSVILFNNKDKSLKKEKSEFKQIFQSTNNENKYFYLKSEIGLKNHLELVHDGRKGPMKEPLTFSNSDSKLGCEELKSKETNKSWMCSFCAMDFDTKSNLRDHGSLEHKRVILQNCPFCDKTFPTSKALRKHIKCSGLGHRGL